MADDAPTAFFSYCRNDSDFALRLAEDLKAAGAAVWIDQLDIDPGTRWDRAVEDALNNCPRMLVILSPLSVQSDNVRDEISFALRKQKTVIPVLYLDCDIPIRLERHQQIDFRTDYTRGLKTLCKALGVPPPQRLTPAPSAPKKRRRNVSDEEDKRQRPVEHGRRMEPAGEQAAEQPRPAWEIYPTIVEKSQQDKLERARLADEPPARIFQSKQEPKTLELREQRTLTGHSDAITALVVTLDGQRAVSASHDHTLKVWDVASGHELCTLKGHSGYVNGVAVTPDGLCAVSASGDETLKLWALANGHELRTLRGHTGWVRAVAVTPDGQRAVSASSDRTLKVWELGSGRELRTLTGHSGPLAGVAMTPDGRRAVSACGDGTLKVWELGSGRVLRTFKGHADYVEAVTVTPDGQHAVSASWDKTLKLWELDSGRELRTLKGHADHVNAVAVTADGRRAVSASSDQTLKVWELGSGRELATFKVDAVLYGCAVSPDDEIILAGDLRGVIHWYGQKAPRR